MYLGRLKEKADFKSELSGELPTTYNPLVTHHIKGRTGILYTDPFNLIVCLQSEHQTNKDAIHKHNTPEKKQELMDIVRPIRLKQGYKESDY